MCTDYRKVNDTCYKNGLESFSRIGDCIDTVGKAKFVSQRILTSAAYISC